MIQHFKDVIQQKFSNSPENQANTAFMLTPKTIENYPEFLYKYRTCNKEHDFEMLEQEYIWADYPTTFDDPFDAIVNIKLKTEYKDIIAWFNQHICEMIYYKIPPVGMAPSKQGQKLENYIEAQKRFEINGKISAKSITASLTTELSKLPYKQKQNAIMYIKSLESSEFEEKVKENFKNALEVFVNTLRKEAMMTCLSTRNNNQKMWEDYSAKYTGFVIQYKRPKFKDMSDEEKQLMTCLFPVSYYKRIPGVPILPIIDYVFKDKLYGIKSDIPDAIIKWFCQMLYKRIEYNSEEEWRIIEDKKENKINFPYISAVYAGYKIENKNLIRLKSICQKKEISLYKQEFNQFTQRMDFKMIIRGRDNA